MAHPFLVLLCLVGIVMSGSDAFAGSVEADQQNKKGFEFAAIDQSTLIEEGLGPSGLADTRCRRSSRGAQDSVIGRLFIERNKKNNWRSDLAMCVFDSRAGGPFLLPLDYGFGAGWSENALNSVQIKYISYRQGDVYGYIVTWMAHAEYSLSGEPSYFGAVGSVGAGGERVKIGEGIDGRFQGCHRALDGSALRICVKPSLKKQQRITLIADGNEATLNLWKITNRAFVPYDPRSVSMTAKRALHSEL